MGAGPVLEGTFDGYGDGMILLSFIGVAMIATICGWAMCSLFVSAKLNDQQQALEIAAVEAWALQCERDKLLHATRTQFRRKAQ
jgi:hypothetical protein